MPQMNKAIIKKLLVYFLTRDIPILLSVLVFMSSDRWLALSHFVGVILYCIPVVFINTLLFIWPYAYVLKRCAAANRRTPYEWCLVGLLLLEAILVKVSIYEDLPLLLLFFVFIYLVAFTWIYFNNIFKEKDKALSGSAHH